MQRSRGTTNIALVRRYSYKSGPQFDHLSHSELKMTSLLLNTDITATSGHRSQHLADPFPSPWSVSLKNTLIAHW